PLQRRELTSDLLMSRKFETSRSKIGQLEDSGRRKRLPHQNLILALAEQHSVVLLRLEGGWMLRAKRHPPDRKRALLQLLRLPVILLHLTNLRQVRECVPHLEPIRTEPSLLDGQ